MSGQGRGRVPQDQVEQGADDAMQGTSVDLDPEEDGMEVDEAPLFQETYELLIKGVDFVACQYNSDHFIPLDELEKHEKNECQDRGKWYVKDESEIPAALAKKTVEKMAGRKSRIYGTGCGDKGTSIWVLKGLKTDDSEEEEEEDDEEDEEEEPEKTEVELEEEEWTKPTNGMKKWDYFEHMRNLKAPGRVVNSYPPHLTTKQQRREWDKENARQMEINYARRQQQIEEENRQRQVENLRSELDSDDED